MSVLELYERYICRTNRVPIRELVRLRGRGIHTYAAHKCIAERHHHRLPRGSGLCAPLLIDGAEVFSTV